MLSSALCGVIGEEKITFAMCHFANYLAELFPLRPPSAATGVPLPARSRMRARASSSVTSATRHRRARFSPKSAPPAAVPKVCPQISWPRLAKQVREDRPAMVNHSVRTMFIRSSILRAMEGRLDLRLCSILSPVKKVRTNSARESAFILGRST